AESRLTTFLAVTQGKAVDMLGSEVKLERFPIEAVREILQSDASIRFSIKDAVLSMSNEGSDAIFPYLELVKTKVANEESEEIRATGYVLMKTGQKAAILRGEEAQVIRFLKEDFRPFSQLVQLD